MSHDLPLIPKRRDPTGAQTRLLRPLFWLFGCLARPFQPPLPACVRSPFHTHKLRLSLGHFQTTTGVDFLKYTHHTTKLDKSQQMSLQRVARANVLRHLRLGDASSHQTRVIGVQNQLRRLSLATNPRFSTPLAGSPSAMKPQQSQSFATDATKSDSAKKSTKKSTTKEPKAEKKKTKRVLTEKQKEAKEKKESRELVKQLKETALQPPKKLPQVARSIAIQHKIKELREQSSSTTPVEIFKEAVSQVYSQRLNEADVRQTKRSSSCYGNVPC